MAGKHRHLGLLGKWITALGGDGDHVHPELTLAFDDAVSAAVEGLQGQINALKPPTPAPRPLPAGRALQTLPIPSMVMPAYGQSVGDPVTGSRVTNISALPGIRQAYPMIQQWNCAPRGADSRILLGFTPNSARLVHGDTYADLGNHPVPSYAMWSNTNPWLLYGAVNNLLITHDVRDGKQDTLFAFAGSVSIGNFEGGVSDDDGTIALIVGGTQLVTFDLVLRKIISAIGIPDVDGLQISRDGQYVVVRGGTTYRYTRDLRNKLQLLPTANHSDNASGGRYIAVNAPGVVSVDVMTGGITTLWPRSAFEYGHVGAHGLLPVLSSYDPITMAGRPGHDQIVGIAPDGGAILYTFSQRRLSKSYDAMTSDEKIAAYPGEPHAGGDRTGRRVLYAVERNGDVRAYVAELP